jgi:hypothetical protein
MTRVAQQQPMAKRSRDIDEGRSAKSASHSSSSRCATECGAWRAAQCINQ